MSEKNIKILCVFTKGEKVLIDLNQILSSYKENINSDIYLYKDVDDENKMYLTTTIEIDNNIKGDKRIKNSILVHRKKESNTLFTVNALNEIIFIENNGVIDKKYEVNWLNYKNQLLLTDDLGLKKINLLFKGKLNKQNIFSN